MNLNELRSNFPHTEKITYLNHAATGPLSIPVLRSIQAFLEQRHGTNIDNYTDFAPVVDSARRRIASLLGTHVDRVEFAPNTSYGLDVLARGLSWRPGDRIAVPGCEFPANVYPFLNLGRLGVEVDFIPHENGIVTLEGIERSLRPDTRLLSISWVQFLSGMRTDLKAVGALCRERGIVFCVDAIQGLGALQLNVEDAGIDFLACGGHKWIMSTQGIGFLYLSEALQERITPPAGWQHGPVDWDNFYEYRLQFHADASRFRMGTMNNIGIASLDAALTLYEDAGPQWCEREVLARAGQLADGFAVLGLPRYGSTEKAHASGIVTVKHPDADGLEEHLLAHSIKAAVRQKMLRFAPTYYNSPAEIDRTLNVIESFKGS